jgi:C1A family cysteine protease
MLTEKKFYRVKQDRADWRDFPYKPVGTPLREQVDLRKWASAVESQGHLGSCTGQATVGAYELLLNKEVPDKFVDLSRLFVYYNARLLEGETGEDIGAYVRDAIKGVRQYGACKESIWPYIIEDYATVPSAESYTDAKQRNIKNYYRLLSLEDVLDALNNDWPVVFSCEVYPGFDDMKKENDVISLPKESAYSLGGHAMVFVGYDMTKQQMLVRNSFGTDWGNEGYCWMPFEYARKELMDRWVFDIEIVEAQSHSL